jgi:SAM-dependent methyltransferase
VDLDPYLAIAQNLKARSILDVGCGTGAFACLCAAKGFDVLGVDPAAASLEIARRKPFGDQVRWIVGDAACVPPSVGDLAVMTGNVAQVFLTDEAFENTLQSIRYALRPDGHLVFEARVPAQKAWLKWTRERTYKRIEIQDIGFVEGWCDVTNISGAFVSFRWTYVFESDGAILTSDSTLRFRDKDEIVQSLEQAGYRVTDVLDAPDRPGQEFVFITRV